MSDYEELTDQQLNDLKENLLKTFVRSSEDSVENFRGTAESRAKAGRTAAEVAKTLLEIDDHGRKRKHILR